MESIRAKFYSIETEMLQRNIPITTQNVLDIYKNGFAETKLTVLILSAKTRNNAPRCICRYRINIYTQKTYNFPLIEIFQTSLVRVSL